MRPKPPYLKDTPPPGSVSPQVTEDIIESVPGYKYSPENVELLGKFAREDLMETERQKLTEQQLREDTYWKMREETYGENQRDRRFRDWARSVTDPIINGISFSGADVTATVFVPYSYEYITQRFNELQKQISDLEKQYKEYMNEYSNLIKKAQTSSDPVYREMLREFDGFGHIRMIPQYLSQLREEQNRILAGADKLDKSKFNNPKTLKQEANKVLGVRAIKLGDIQTLTTSVHRYKAPIRTLGSTYAKSYIRGSRTIAGTIVFTLFNQHCLMELLKANMQFYNTGVRGSDGAYPEYSTALIDQLPPFDIVITASNELGANSYMVLYGVELVSEGITMSIQDLATENVVQYIARDFDPLVPLTQGRTIYGADNFRLTAEGLTKTNVFANRKKKMNPFI